MLQCDRGRTIGLSSLGIVLFVLLAGSLFAQERGVIYSQHTPNMVDLNPDPDSPFWRDAPPVVTDADTVGRTFPAYRTEIRSRWDGQNLHILYSCAADTITLNPSPDRRIKTHELYRWDIAELMIGSDFANIEIYAEFGASAQEEWYDYLRGVPENRGGGFRWTTGFKVKGRIDRERKLWYLEMSIPLNMLDPKHAPAAGNRFRVNFYRYQYVDSRTLYLAWRPTGVEADFSIPKAFGILILK
jgi:hypothetical protein